MKVAIYTICKNEKKYISRFLKNIQDADYICLLDTGSTDGTWEYLKNTQKKTDFSKKLIIAQKIFENFRFDTARNEALLLVPKDADICVKLDIDEYFSKGKISELPKLIQELIPANVINENNYILNIAYKEYLRRGLRFELTRSTTSACVHSNNPVWTWKFPVHEDLVGDENSRAFVTSELEISHTPVAHNSSRYKKKVAFYNELLKKRYEENPDDLASHYQWLYNSFQEDFEKVSREEIPQKIYELLSDMVVSPILLYESLIVFSIFAYKNNLTHSQFEKLKKLYALDIIESNLLSEKQLKEFEELKGYFKNFPGFYFLQVWLQTKEFDFNTLLNLVSQDNSSMDYHILRENIEQTQRMLETKKATVSLINPNFSNENQVLLNKAIYHTNALFSIIRSMEIINPLQRLGIEVLCTTHCNLNCAYCNHFAPIADHENYSVDQYTADMERLSQLFPSEIFSIKLMGGEPLLHPEIEKLMKITRQHFPETDIVILTNGILLSEMPESFWQACLTFKVKINITPYKVLDIEKLKALTQKYQIDFFWYPDSMNEPGKKVWMEKFCVNLNGDTQVKRRFLDCSNANKTLSLKDGYLYTCPFKATVKFFAKKFNYNLPDAPEINGVNIQEASRSEILSFLCNPTELCKYCQGECGPVLWRKSSLQREEWLIDPQHAPRYLSNRCYAYSDKE